MNRLQHETSPYLQQHKNNPVDWYPWSDEALRLARTEDKVIVLSIGYSACHWCHVMEHESFEDQEVAHFMNTHFVNIKVDREERPDIDSIYMEALQHMGIRGGWPLNVFLLPTGEPFYGGTYFPKAKWLNALKGIKQVFENKREEVMASGRGFVKSLNQKDSDKYSLGSKDETASYSFEELERVAEIIAKDFDTHDGGMNRAPKFPMPSVWNMVFSLFKITQNTYLNEHLEFTLGRIALGGIYDHLGGGWTRYSTDHYWKVPHFEKMLYDNGQLMKIYSKVAKKSNAKELYRWAVDGTYKWVTTDMNASGSGIFSAQDADSEGEEGKFYVWKFKEIQEILKEEAESFLYEYGISVHGNWENGNNILHLEHFPENWEKIKISHEILLEERKKKIYPGLDNKILTGWNALMVSGLLERSKTFDLDYSFAQEKLDYIIQDLTFVGTNEDQLNARGVYHQVGTRKILGFLDDYAALIQACIDMYSVSFEEKYLAIADELTRYTIGNFYDYEEGLFYFTDSEGEKLVARKKEIFDNVIPSSNSMIAKTLYWLGRYLDEPSYCDLSFNMFKKIKPLTLLDPQWLSNWVDLGILLTLPQKEIVVTGKSSKNWIKELMHLNDSDSTLFLCAETSSNLSHFKNRFLDKDSIFICENKICNLPIFDLEEAKEILKR